MTQFIRLFFSSLIIVFLQFSLSAQEIGSEKSETFVIEKGQKLYIHTINAGETLYSLGKLYGVSVEEIAAKNVNVLKGLSVGQQIKIPFKEKTEIVKLSNVNGVKSYTHVVKLGETLYGISKKYNVSPEQIKEHNVGLTNILTVGQVLYIPTASKSSVSSNQTTTTTVAPVKGTKSTNKVVISGKTYLLHKVIQGETVFSIKTLYNVPQEVLLKENPDLKNGLKTGQELKIPLETGDFVERKFILHTVDKAKHYIQFQKIFGRGESFYAFKS
ncbi:MAG: LysM peptidoglycan-binding domain-containing protein [Bacteroidales bacterium]|nr:LysM peptidoglycan-binding domain-containing protein [Bacteroidales bacterium]